MKINKEYRTAINHTTLGQGRILKIKINRLWLEIKKEFKKRFNLDTD